MPYIFSDKQVIHAHFLITEHNMDVKQLAEELGTSTSKANHLIKEVWQKYEQPKKIGKSCRDAKGIDLMQKVKLPLLRPKAEYSNKRLYDLV